jgi:hypothetical protein
MRLIGVEKEPDGSLERFGGKVAGLITSLKGAREIWRMGRAREVNQTKRGVRLEDTDSLNEILGRSFADAIILDDQNIFASAAS